ncbi:MAG TPA: metalloregulator ArsR/SmtB family transcription factor [Ktedonobacterales bacterium]|nr:metalloregulator ArsR/SmtB family transcription factor [Ktedonobacterales bacterium]
MVLGPGLTAGFILRTRLERSPQATTATSPVNGIYTAIAHPVRRQLLDRLLDGEQSVRNLAGSFPVSRPAVSQHLRVLLEAGLVAERREGRERHYYLQPERLREVQQWLRKYERFWQDHLTALTTYLETEP